jgi:hypothetical protein
LPPSAPISSRTCVATSIPNASARSHVWRGLALYGVDGTTLRVPDSTDNAGYFGYEPVVVAAARFAHESLILPPRRSERRFPRAVKIKMSNDARKHRKGSI